MILDTCFLIQLSREQRHPSRRGHATAFLEAHASDSFNISIISRIEFLEGYSGGDILAGSAFLGQFRAVGLTEAIADRVAALRRSLRERGSLIGDFDLIIAASGLELGEALVTRNTRHFQRIDGLRVIDYASGAAG